MSAQRSADSGVSGGSDTPFNLGPDRKFVMTWKTFFAIVSLLVLATGSWLSIKSDVTDHGKQLEMIVRRLSSIESDSKASSNAVMEVSYQQKLLKQSVDYLVNDRRGPKPATSSP